MGFSVVCEFRVALLCDANELTKHVNKSRSRVSREQKMVTFRLHIRVTALCFQTEDALLPSLPVSSQSGLVPIALHGEPTLLAISAIKCTLLLGSFSGVLANQSISPA